MGQIGAGTCASPYWLLTDHPRAALRGALGSIAEVVDESGNVIAEHRYYAFGDYRFDSGTLPAKYGSTAQ